ncbi:hypothetical protein GCM10009691_23810 [Brevibacterium picturae]|uniref:Uncharacterized protein n=1 Tax=Brevibacterium picturae TaxID=260553 RepID=A0ABP4MPY2_9MICO
MDRDYRIISGGLTPAAAAVVFELALSETAVVRPRAVRVSVEHAVLTAQLRASTSSWVPRRSTANDFHCP